MTQFVDKATLTLKAGDGGAGATSFRREKFVPMGGPDGGKGGDGGSVIFKATHKVQSLIDLKTNKVYKAENGKQGMGKKKSGPAGCDLIISLPIGTQIYDQDNVLIYDLTKQDDTFIVAKGGRGGQGNSVFSSSVNRSPQHSQPGMPGDQLTVFLELRLIAEIGLIGLPNAGKSSLLKTLTNANTEIGDYPFTTLHPNLGTLKTDDREIILADIPGLIKGASQGKGLGADFLRHIDRTRMLIHLVPADPSPDVVWDYYQTTLHELTESSYSLLDKPSIILLSKADLLDSDTENAIISFFKQNEVSLLPVSAFTKHGISSLINLILSMSQES
ncbi:GTPase ObgE [Candidatus Marinamargulisbacteria bacterium SCGC AG-333-B06]|nr:GTPase ObgE [Candidatus Marinamargulisbacteria bacterium SCGC AG-333-B06]